MCDAKSHFRKSELSGCLRSQNSSSFNACVWNGLRWTDPQNWCRSKSSIYRVNLNVGIENPNISGGIRMLYSQFKKVVALQKGGNADRRTLRESNSYFPRHATTTKQKSELYQELQQYMIVIFNGLYKIRLSPRQPDNNPDLAIRNNRSVLIEICRITNIAHIFGFNTLFSLLWLDNTIRNPSETFRIPILQI
jgi:hypothetical protein